MQQKTIIILVDKDGPIDLPKDAKALRPELEAFESWFIKRGGSSLTGYERSILLTFLGWKLVDEGSSGDANS